MSNDLVLAVSLEWKAGLHGFLFPEKWVSLLVILPGAAVIPP